MYRNNFVLHNKHTVSPMKDKTVNSVSGNNCYLLYQKKCKRNTYTKYMGKIQDFIIKSRGIYTYHCSKRLKLICKYFPSYINSLLIN